MGIRNQETENRGRVNTGGGALVEGDLIVEHGDFVGRDKIVVGDVDASVMAIGDGAQVIYQNIERALTEIELLEQAQVFARRQMAEAVKRYVEELIRAAEQTWETASQGNPYKELLEYNIDDAALFYGRARAKEALMHRLERGRLTVLHAASGAGKTSLLKASIMPELLARGHVPLWLRPHRTPVVQEIKNQLLPQLPHISVVDESSLHGLLTKATDLLGGKYLVILVDQFEEVFDNQEPKQRVEFFEQLARCLKDATLRVRWVLALRGEYFTRLSTFPEDAGNPFANEYALQPLTPEEAEQVIVEPARTRGIDYDPPVVKRILADLDREGVEPPQLQLVCWTLFDSLEPNQKIIGEEMYGEGGARLILQDYLGRVIERDILPEQREAAWFILEALVTSQGRRQQRTHRELKAESETHGIDAEMVAGLLPQLARSRLVRPLEGPQVSTDPAYELTHDYLVGRIHLASTVLDRKRAQEVLAEQVRSYRDYDTLLSARELQVVEEQSKYVVLSEDESAAIELDLLFRSAQRHNHSLDPWCDSAVRLGLVGQLAGLWAESLRDQEPKKANDTVALLVSLPGADTVPPLVDLLEAEAAAAGKSTLHTELPLMQHILATLAQIDCDEARDRLQQLMPQEFCFVPAGYLEPKGDGESEGRKWLNAFAIARSPVTLDDWADFVEAGGYREKRYWRGLDERRGGHRTVLTGWTVGTGQGKQPICDVTWDEAMAYARWLAETTGLPVDLPTETEWDRASSWDPVIKQSMERACRAHRRPWDPNKTPLLAGCRVCLRLVPLKGQAEGVPSAIGPTPH